MYCRVDNRDSRHFKFLRGMLSKLLIVYHPLSFMHINLPWLAIINNAVTKYLEAYKQLPDNPLINLCVDETLYFYLIS